MSIDMNVAKQIIHEKICEAKDFSLDELEKEIVKEGGVLRVSSGVTVKDYLKILDEAGVIKYNPNNDNYIVFNGKLEEILSLSIKKN